jgi:hypothetical protein
VSNLTQDDAYSSGATFSCTDSNDQKIIRGSGVWYVTDPSVAATVYFTATSAAAVTYGGYSITTYSRNLGRKRALLQIDKKMKELRKLIGQASKLGLETPDESVPRGLVPPDQKGDRKEIDWSKPMSYQDQKDTIDRGHVAAREALKRELQNYEAKTGEKVPPLQAVWFDRKERDSEFQNDRKDLMTEMIEAKRAKIAQAVSARMAEAEPPTPPQEKAEGELDVLSMSSGPERDEEFGALHVKQAQQAEQIAQLQLMVARALKPAPGLEPK